MMHRPKLTRQYLRDNERVAMFKKVWLKRRVYYFLVLPLMQVWGMCLATLKATYDEGELF